MLAVRLTIGVSNAICVGLSLFAVFASYGINVISIVIAFLSLIGAIGIMVTGQLSDLMCVFCMTVIAGCAFMMFPNVPTLVIMMFVQGINTAVFMLSLRPLTINEILNDDF